MLFNSYEFIFVFLPATALLWLGLRRIGLGAMLAGLVIASLFFYAWWDVRFLPLLLISLLVNFSVGRAIAATSHLRQRLWLVFGILFNLGLLGFFKYADFAVEIAGALASVELLKPGVVLPIGISFFTFQQIAYLVDVSQGKSERYKLRDYAFFVVFFPQLIAGPIVHHQEIMPQLMRRYHPKVEDAAVGLSIFIAGLIKKSVFADNIATFASPVFAAADAGQAVSFAEAWGGVLAYSLQIYFDFSGYSDMAIGLARMFGVRLPINFASPYKAKSITEFWRRWHISLSRFLRDYLYIPLGGNRLGRPRRYVNLMTTMLLGGLWHGAGWGFLIWGGLHGLYLTIDHASKVVLPRIGIVGRVLGSWPVGGAVTFMAVVFAWVFFRAETAQGAATLVSAMLGFEGLTLPEAYRAGLGPLASPLEAMGISFALPAHLSLREWSLTGVPLIGAGLMIAWLAPNTNEVFLANDPWYGDQVALESRWVPRWEINLGWTIVGICAVCFWVLFAADVSEFLYFQF